MWQPSYLLGCSLLLLLSGLPGSLGERHHFGRRRRTYDELCLGKDNIAGIYSPQSWIHAGRKSTVELFCRVCGVADNCQYTVRWSKDGETLSHRKSSRIHAYIVSKSKHLYGLRIQNFRNKDYGLYSCSYYTSTGDELETQIEISGIPLPPSLSPQPTFNSRNSVTLDWSVNSSTPIINYELEFRDLSPEGEEGSWVLMNIPAKNKKKVYTKAQSYRLNGLLHGTTYQARIRSRNIYGLSNFSSVLKFQTLRDKESEGGSSSIQNDANEEILYKRSDLLSNSVLAQEELDEPIHHPDGKPLKTKESRGYAAYSDARHLKGGSLLLLCLLSMQLIDLLSNR
eukprot:TRINITY_DN2580_c0_g1_i1.p1 TRINITY_DN2580_c0_g1~~TRINITY_DN2580_c0_g1_i1.p1  ORF type:complete len:340 (+),score=92.37 TRINITY_DN2580_c0_g1_i1:76-1095(+)